LTFEQSDVGKCTAPSESSILRNSLCGPTALTVENLINSLFDLINMPSQALEEIMKG
jgi:hypothetical protein